MDFQLPDGDLIRLLAPFADMLNHSSEVTQCHTYDALSENLSILAGKDYKPGDQVRPSRPVFVFPNASYLPIRARLPTSIVLPAFHQLRTYSK